MITARETLLSVKYAQTGTSTQGNSMGMREMQARAYEKRNAQYLLIKAPPACGKSRALMFLALDKVIHQGLDKVIVAVPQMAIGSSFKDTNLTENGFFADWKVLPKYNLCMPGSEQSKSDTVLEFMNDKDAHYLICAHPTLIYFFDKLKDKSLLNRTLVAVDEFHHVSADNENRLGGVIHSLMTETSAHIVAMTGSYFRGDRIPVLAPEDEAKFDKVTYTYYEQLNGYKYLKSLGIDYAFYQGQWTDAIAEVLDTHKKTIIHIPSVNSRESTKDKLNEVGAVIDTIGKNLGRDNKTGIYTIQTPDGRKLRVADLVSDTESGMQGTTLAYLREVTNKDDVDIIIALGMAKEGFDWPWCEHALTVGYRNSLTEVVQIIGRATRDAPGKEHAQFTNLIAKPEALQTDVECAVNSLLKAITLSLLMEQVLAPNIHFRIRQNDGQNNDQDKQDDAYTITINDDEAHLSKTARQIIENETDDIITQLLNSSTEVANAIVTGDKGTNELLLKSEVPQLITKMYPDAQLSDDEIDTISEIVVTILNLKKPYKLVINEKPEPEPQTGGTPEKPLVPPQPGPTGDGELVIDNRSFLNVGGKFINLDEFDINLILKVNPFQEAYDFISRNIDSTTLRTIQDKVVAKRSKVTEQEACLLWPHVKAFKRNYQREPNPHSQDDYEKRLAEVLAYVRNKKAQSLGAQRS